MKFRTNVLETAAYHREFDDKWEVLGRIKDTENSYTYTNEVGKVVTYVPDKWVCIDVLDTKSELKKYNLAV